MADTKTLNITIRYSINDDPMTLQLIKEIMDSGKGGPTGTMLTDNISLFDFEPDEEIVSVEFTKD